MSAGQMRHRITVESRSEVADAVGQTVETWSTVADTWAAIKPVSGREYYTASSERAELTHEIRMRAGVTVRPRDRIVFGSRVFDVRAVMDENERGRWLDVQAVERAAV